MTVKLIWKEERNFMEIRVSEHEEKPVISTKRTYGGKVKEMSRGIHLRMGKLNGKKEE